MGNPIQPLARGFTMIDASGSPKTSPVASAGSDEVSIVVPASSSSTHLFRLNVYAPSFAITLRKIAGGATGGTCTIPQATWFSIPCVPGDTLYFARTTATTIEFLFEDMY